MDWTMCINRRHIAAVVLGVMYVMIALSPLATQLAMQSPLVAHAVAGQCAGDCSICGCSPERSASHTCCCWLNKQQGHDDEPECCRKTHEEADGTPSFRNFSPCNSNGGVMVTWLDQSEIIPYNYILVRPPINETANPPHGDTEPYERSIPPPDPPPKVAPSA